MATRTTKKAVNAGETAPEEQPLNAVIIVKTVDEDGNVGTNVALNGDVQATEVQTLIEFGLRGWRSQLGLTD